MPRSDPFENGRLPVKISREMDEFGVEKAVERIMIYTPDPAGEICYPIGPSSGLPGDINCRLEGILL
jgi:hypothetical protein